MLASCKFCEMIHNGHETCTRPSRVKNSELEQGEDTNQPCLSLVYYYEVLFSQLTSDVGPTKKGTVVYGIVNLCQPFCMRGRKEGLPRLQTQNPSFDNISKSQTAVPSNVEICKRLHLVMRYMYKNQSTITPIIQTSTSTSSP